MGFDLSLDPHLLREGQSAPQRTRRATETWVEENAYCVNCGRDGLDRLPNNTPFRDFECSRCHEPFELKSSKSRIGNLLKGGSLKSYEEAFRIDRVPNFLVLAYSPTDAAVVEFEAFNRSLVSPLALRARARALSAPGREKYLMCNIDVSGIPSCAKIPLIRNGFERPRLFVRESWDRFAFLREPRKGVDPPWIRDILTLIARLPGREFTPKELYAFEGELSRLHPDNKHVPDKIRQQLQILVKRGVIRRIVKGVYETIY